MRKSPSICYRSYAIEFDTLITTLLILVRETYSAFPSAIVWLRLSQCRRHGVSQRKDRPDGGNHNYCEDDKLRYVIGLCPVGVPITEEPRSANADRLGSFHV